MDTLAQLHKLYNKHGPYKPTGYQLIYKGYQDAILACSCGHAFAVQTEADDADDTGLYILRRNTRYDFLAAVAIALPPAMRKAYMAYIKDIVAPSKMTEIKDCIGRGGPPC